MKSVQKAIWATALALGLGCGVAYAQKLERTQLTVGLPVTTSTFLPLYLAEEAGFFKEEGLEVKLVNFRGGGDLVRGMVAGAVDVAVGAMAELTMAIDAGQPLRAFYGGFNMAVFEWYAVPSITSLADAKGKRFGVTTFGSSTDFLTRYVLTLNHLNPRTDVHIVQGGGSGVRMAAMNAGQLDVNIYAPPETFMSADEGKRLIYRQTDIAKDYPYHTFYAPLKFLESNPQTIKALLRAFVRGVRLAKSDKERAVQVIARRIKIKPDYAARTYDVIIGELYEDGRFPSEAGMAAFWKIGVQNGMYKEAWPMSRYAITDYLRSYSEWKPK